MLINGEKFACEACVRGHRVSSCQHQDRPLIHVNKKGRPVSQCHHCRGLRKARAQHVKCDCADKGHSKEDCPHDKGETQDGQICCCGHGARCTCSLKKEHLDTVPEDIPQIVHPTVLPKDPHKHRLSNLISHESKTTIFTNGHHKPVHKINDAHNHCGAPYKIPNRAHTIHGHREIAQRSTDSLPSTKTALTGAETPLHHDAVTSAPQPIRMVKSEHGSPERKAVPDLVDAPLQSMVIPPLDPNAYSYSPFDNNSPGVQQTTAPDYAFPEIFPESFFMSYEQAHDYEPAFPSAGLSDGAPEIDWSTFNFQTDQNGMYNLNNNAYVPSQPPSYASFEHLSHLGHPGLTSSSGEISEVEDYVPVTRPGNLRAVSHDAANDFSSLGGDDASSAYRLSSASSYIGLPQTTMLANGKLDSSDIDDYLKLAEAETRQARLQSSQFQPQQQKQLPQYQQADQPRVAQSRNFSTSSNLMGEHPFTIQEAQNYAHMNGTVPVFDPESSKSPMPASSMAEDPMWSSPEDVPAGVDADIDADWVR